MEFGIGIYTLLYLKYREYLKESEEEQNSLLMRVKKESEKAALKLNIKKLRSQYPIISWQIEGGKIETVIGLLYLGSKITVDGDCSQEIRRYLGRKHETNLDSVFKSRGIFCREWSIYSKT